MNKEQLLKQKQELDNQIAEIEENEYKQKIENNKIRLNKLRENKEFILSLFEHQRASCSDDYVSNGYGSASYGARCSKCHLIEILNSEWDNEFEFEVDFDIAITKITR